MLDNDVNVYIRDNKLLRRETKKDVKKKSTTMSTNADN